MPYTIDFSDTGKTPIVLNDGTVDTSTSLVLVGKNVTRFGEYFGENFVKLLENFASATAPSNPTEGQLWYDSGNSALKLYDNGQWYLMGSPAGTTRVEVRQRLDTLAVSHFTVETIVDSNIVSIIVDDTTAWQPATSEYLEDGVTLLNTQFPVIQAGINLNNTSGYKFRGTATSADYADLAERYASDQPYKSGTVVRLGGIAEITQTLQYADSDVFGVISTSPGFEMNAGAGTNDTHPFVALAGRVPCRVVGKVSKGERLTTSNVPGCAQAVSISDRLDYRVIIGRALADKDNNEEGLIEIVVGAK
jgi:hypothetical protein